jgi:hypothetical protein
VFPEPRREILPAEKLHPVTLRDAMAPGNAVLGAQMAGELDECILDARRFPRRLLKPPQQLKLRTSTLTTGSLQAPTIFNSH